jgi:hypothetical protein
VFIIVNIQREQIIFVCQNLNDVDDKNEEEKANGHVIVINDADAICMDCTDYSFE